MADSLHILQLNTQSLQSSHQYLPFLQQVTNADCICLQETWTRDTSPRFKDWKTRNYTINTSKQAGFGVANLVNPKIKTIQRTDLDNPQLECMWTEIVIQDTSILIGNAYIEPLNLVQLNELDKTLCKITNTNVILLGDFNCRSSTWDIRCKRTNRRGKLLEEILLNHRLRTINNPSTPTCFMPAGSSSVDITTIRGLTNVDWRTIDPSPIKTMHKGILISFRALPSWRLNAHNPLRFKTKNADWTAWKNHYQSITFDNPPEDAAPIQINDAIVKLNERIISDAKQLIGVQNITRHSKKWWSEEVKQALREQRTLRNRYSRRKTPQNHDALKAANTKLQEAIIKAKNTHYTFKVSQLNKAKSGPQFWHTFNKLFNNTSTNTVEPLQTTNIGQYDIDDKVISDRLAKVHILRDGNTTDTFDDNFKNGIEQEVNNLITSIQSNQPDAPHQDDLCETDLTLAEFNRAINQINTSSSPGPDNIPANLIIKAGVNLHQHLFTLMRTSFRGGFYPATWKRDYRIYFKKPDKEDHHNEKAYRPISLTDMMGKIYEKILFNRITSILEQTGFLNDKNIYAYRKGLSTTHALLRLTEQMHNCLNSAKTGAAVIADLEGAFDATWRTGIIHKLANASITGHLLLACHSFLQGRFTRNLVNSHVGSWLQTEHGTPQGSILSVIFFSVYTSDLSCRYTAIPATVWTQEPSASMQPPHAPVNPPTEEAKYADDYFTWDEDDDPNNLAERIEQGCINLNTWSRHWRINISIAKTKLMVFKKGVTPNLQVQYNGVPLEQVSTKRILGVQYDSKLKFDQHVEKISSSAKNAANLLLQLTELNVKSTIGLFKAFCRSRLEYAVLLWGHNVNKYGNGSKLQSAQRHGIRALLNATPSTPTATMEVELDLPPIDLRLDELIRISAAKIMAKPDDDPIRTALSSKTAVTRPNLSPVDHINGTIQDLHDSLTTTYGTYTLEQQSPSVYPQLLINVTSTNMEQCLGNSATRTRAQADLGRALIEQQLADSNSPDTVIIFTDGSSLGNPGPTGAGAVIRYDSDSPPVELIRPIDIHSNNFHGELSAIELALSHLKDNVNATTSKVNLFCDCKAAIQVILSSTPPNNHYPTVQAIRNHIHSIGQSLPNLTINLIWTPGHANIQLNDRADKLAKQAAQRAMHMRSDHHLVTPQEAITASRNITRQKFAQRWQLSPSNTYKDHYDLLPDKISRHLTTDSIHPIIQRKITRLRLNHTYLPAHKAVYAQATDRNCPRCHRPCDPTHALLECPSYDQERFTMLSEAAHALELDSCISDTHASLPKLLGLCPAQQLTADTAYKLLSALAKFLEQTALDC